MSATDGPYSTPRPGMIYLDKSSTSRPRLQGPSSIRARGTSSSPGAHCPGELLPEGVCEWVWGGWS